MNSISVFFIRKTQLQNSFLHLFHSSSPLLLFVQKSGHVGVQDTRWQGWVAESSWSDKCSMWKLSCCFQTLHSPMWLVLWQYRTILLILPPLHTRNGRINNKLSLLMSLLLRIECNVHVPTVKRLLALLAGWHGMVRDTVAEGYGRQGDYGRPVGHFWALTCETADCSPAPPSSVFPFSACNGVP